MHHERDLKRKGLLCLYIFFSRRGFIKNQQKTLFTDSRAKQT